MTADAIGCNDHRHGVYERRYYGPIGLEVTAVKVRSHPTGSA